MYAKRLLWLLPLGFIIGLLIWFVSQPVKAPQQMQSTIPPSQPDSRLSAPKPDTPEPTPDTPAVRFTDVTTAAGIHFTHFAGAEGNKWYPETIGSGVGFFDYNGDGWPDILLVNGTHWSANGLPEPLRPEPTMQLYRNLGNGTFDNVTQQAGLAVPLYGMGLAAADYDNDGDTDILVTGYLHNLFFINNGDGTFTEAAQRLGLQDGKWGGGAAFFDYDRDGWLDLVISNYIDWQPALEQELDCTYGMPAKDYCPVRYFQGQGIDLYHNRGDGTFEDVTQQAGVASSGTRAFAPYIFDVDEDHWPDILVTSDGTPSLLLRNAGDGTFEEIGGRTGLVLDEGGAAYAGMGIDATYPNNDGQLCIAIGNFVGEPTTLHCRVRQEQGYLPELYAEVSAPAGIGHPTLQSVTFGLFFVDVDLDGFEDLFMVNGHVVDEAELRHAPRAQLPQFFRNLGNGSFADSTPRTVSGLERPLVGRGAAYADYDGDGDVDILVSQNQAPALLLRNDTEPRGHYLRVRLQGTRSNRDGIGAVVRVLSGAHVLRQMLRSGRSYYSQNESVLTFGLGTATTVEQVEIVWPSGATDIYQDVPIDTTLQAIEGSQTPVSTFLGTPRTSTPAMPIPTALDATTSTAYLAHTKAGITAYHAKQYVDAVENFEAAIALHAADPLPYRYLLDIYWRQDKKEKAQQTVEALAAVIPDAYFLDRLGSAYEASDLPGLALLLYRRAVRSDPRFPSAHYNLGRLLSQQGDVAAGIAAIQEALRLYPDFAVAHETLGMAFTEQGQWDKAITHLQRALALHPELATARNHLGRIYRAQGRLDEAMATFQELVARHPDAAEAHHNLAVVYARKGLREQALEEFQEAVRRRPDLHEARIDMAALLLEMQQPQQAIDTLQAVLAAISQDVKTGSRIDVVEVRYRLGIAYLMAQQVAAGIKELEAVLEQRPEYAGAHVQLGYLYYRMGQFARAWWHAQQAEALGQPVPELMAALRKIGQGPSP